MKKNKLLVLCMILLFLCLNNSIAISQTSNSNGYRGIMPMQSTCRDVERMLGGKHCGKSQTVFILDEEEIRIAYSTKKCQTFYGLSWDVPIGTVVIVERRFLNPITLVDLEMELGILIDEDEFKKIPDYPYEKFRVDYVKKTGEIYIISEPVENTVSRVRYYPSKLDESKFLCDKK